MPKKNALATLRKLFGQPEDGEFDPELFLLRLGEKITSSQKELAESVKASAPVDQIDHWKNLNESVQQMVELQKALSTAIAERKIEKVEVERVREIPPSKMHIEVEQKDGPLPEQHQNFFTALFTGAVKAPVDGLVGWLQSALELIQSPKGAIAVRLVDKDGERFYNAVLNAVSGGVTIGLTSVEALLTTLTSRDTNAGSVGANTARVTVGYDTGWITTRANYSAAQTDTAIVTASGAQRIVVKKVSVMADKANSVDVAARIGFGAANTPTGDGTILSHPGIAAGSGAIEFEGESGVSAQTLGDDLRITSEVATGGSIDVIVVYKYGT